MPRGVLLVLALAACAGPAGSAGPVASAQVDLPRSYLSQPADITVSSGTTVTWTNHDQFTHSMRILDGPTATGTNLVMRPGDSVTFRFARPGVYRYDCSFHSQNMKGTVTVR